MLLKPTDHQEPNYSQTKLGLLACCREDPITRQTTELGGIGPEFVN